MKLKVKNLKFLAGKPVCIIHEKTAEKMSLHVSDRAALVKKHKRIISVIDTASGMINSKEVAVSEEIMHHLGLKKGDKIDVKLAPAPTSTEIIRKKMEGATLSRKEIYELVRGISTNELTDVEISFFISGVYHKGMNLRETKDFIDAMLKNSNILKIEGKVADKHSIGGGGNRTTPIIVSVCSAAGLTMPKTSSRAITSAAGTADVIETLAKVDFSAKEIKQIIKKTKACFVWGGDLGLVPVDTRVINVEKELNIDSPAQLLASILSKKIAVDSKYIVIDIPYGKFAKVEKNTAEELKRKFLILAEKFGLKVKVHLTKGSEPIGNGIGPALEMMDVLKVLKKENPPKDLENKALILSGSLLELSGKAKKGEGYNLAKEILDSGKAFRKFEQIIEAQEGKIKPLHAGEYSHNVYARKKSKIRHLSNRLLNQLARFAGCPEDKSAGIYLHKKSGNALKKGDKILTIYAESKDKLKNAVDFFQKNKKQIIEFG